MPRNPDERPDERPPASPNGSRRPGAAAIAVAALAAGATVGEAAERASVSRRTVTRWLRDDRFKARLDEMRAQTVGAALGRLTTSMTKAADVLRELLDHADPHVKHKSAVRLIELGVRVKEAVELEERIRQLEAKLAGVAK